MQAAHLPAVDVWIALARSDVPQQREGHMSSVLAERFGLDFHILLQQYVYRVPQNCMPVC